MPGIISDDKAPVTVNARPRRPIMPSSKLTDTNNYATPELTSHRTKVGTKRAASNTSPPSVDENSESEHADDERGGKKATEQTVKRLRRAHEGPTTKQKNNDTAGASRPSAAPSATYDDMNDPVTTTARPGAASNVSTRAASATVPDDEDDSAVNYGPVPGHKAQRLPTNIYATFDTDRPWPRPGPSQARPKPGLSGQARPVHH
ncbi:hypothetical protein PAXINDRAFT_15294 [Paxillus involutus ATCC 200175]|uniref:Uncharacterized protein n=1 Tax=Paxillus involutus ATCC 200175 TaxID=664439 RepID=A0A0C9TWW9_PAXIN|nr:hypothetical protein PAXINDRAFT_15294 [Paxillus involutus ATCC 200175]